VPIGFGATLLGVFAAIALCVSAVGIYAVVAYGVSQRRAELGIRIALGAQAADIVRTVVMRSGGAVVVGAVCGLAAGFVASRGIERFLFGVTRLDFLALGSAVMLVGGATVAACWAPVRRAIGVDPSMTIRSD
jgi:ABC-type antimicrobial peptide transport system permease subunit